MNGMFPRRHRRPPFELQLTAMIDIFSMIVIFLIKGSVFGASDMAIPPGAHLPDSISHESAESAPQLMIANGQVRASVLGEEWLPLEIFRPAAAPDPRLLKLKQNLKGFVQKLAPEARSSGVLLNVMADRQTPYRDIFDAVRVFRESGFETLLFVATGTGEK